MGTKDLEAVRVLAIASSSIISSSLSLTMKKVLRRVDGADRESTASLRRRTMTSAGQSDRIIWYNVTLSNFTL